MHGSCHCRAIRFKAETAVAAAALKVRRCSCSYCQKAGARWWSDPEGALTLSATDPGFGTYRFGSKTADFLFCPHCGVLMAAYCEIGGTGYAVVNLNAVTGLDAAALPAASFTFESEDTASRLARRQRNWTPAELRSGTSAY